MSGFQELLLIAIILLAIFLVPRMTARNKEQAPLAPTIKRPPWQLSAWLRLAILASVIWLCGCLLYFRPWQGEYLGFAAVGGLPLVVAWGLRWVLAGYRTNRRLRPPINKRR
jgi:hypothetical protein